MKQFLGEINLGYEIEIFPHLNNSNKIIPMGYYVAGIKKIDDALEGKLLHEVDIDFHIVSFEKGICFVFGDLLKGDKFYITRNQIVKALCSEEFYISIVHVSKFVQAFKTGAFGQGLVGSLLSIGVGSVLQTTRRVKTKAVPGFQFHLIYQDDSGIETIIGINVPTEWLSSAEQWLIRNWTN